MLCSCGYERLLSISGILLEVMHLPIFFGVLVENFYPVDVPLIDDRLFACSFRTLNNIFLCRPAVVGVSMIKFETEGLSGRFAYELTRF